MGFKFFSLMTFLSLEKMRLSQHLSALVASSGGFALGVCLAWNSKAGFLLKDVNDLNVINVAFIGIVFNIGASFGALFVPTFLRYLNYTSIMFIALPSYLIGWTLICFARHRILLLIIGRSICGIGSGLSCVLIPIYIAEISNKELRSRLLTLFHFLVNCGVAYAFIMAQLLRENNVIWQYSTICAISCSPIALVYLLPESPLFLLSKNDEVNARQSLEWYSGETHTISEEFEELKNLVKCKQKVLRKIIYNRKFWNSLIGCFGIIFTQQISLINFMIIFANTVFEFGKLTGELKISTMILIIAISQIIVSILGTILLDVIGRRISLFLSASLMGIFLILLGWFLYLREMDPEYDDIYAWMSPTWTILYFAAHNLGVGPLSWTLHVDAFPLEIRVLAAAILTSFSWATSVMGMFIFFKLLMLYNAAITIWIFAGFSLIGAVLLLIFTPDTDGKSLVQIQMEYGMET